MPATAVVTGGEGPAITVGRGMPVRAATSGPQFPVPPLYLMPGDSLAIIHGTAEAAITLATGFAWMEIP